MTKHDAEADAAEQVRERVLVPPVRRLPPSWLGLSRGTAWSRPTPAGATALAAVVAILAWLIAALRVDAPLVLVDEYAFLMGGIEIDRLDHLKKVAPQVPQFGAFLFLRLINLTHQVGAPVDIAIRLCNVAAFAGGAWLLIRRILSAEASWRSAAVAVLICAWPIGSYAAYVMPESLYFLGFAALVAGLMGARGERPILVWAASGAAIAGLTLLKPHGLFVLGAFLAATIAWAVIARGTSLLRAAALCLAAATVYFAAVTVLNGLLAPAVRPEEDIVGGFYWAIVQRMLTDWPAAAGALQIAATNLSGVLVLLAPSLAFLVHGLFAVRRPGVGGPPDLLALSAALLVILVLGVVAAFALLLAFDPLRVHLRYINFALPCVLALAWVWQARRPELDSRAFRLTAAVLWVLAAGYFLWRLPSLRLLPVDAPDLLFAYGKGDFGKLGLGDLARPAIAALVVTGAGLMLLPRWRWFDSQLLVLALLTPISLHNIVAAQSQWSRDAAARHDLGDIAAAVCGTGDNDILAMASLEAFPLLYHPMARIDRAVPLKIVPDAKSPTVAQKAAPGTCILTTVNLTSTQGPPVAALQGIYLFRKP